MSLSQLVGRAVVSSLTLLSWRFFASLLLSKYLKSLFYHCPCPTAHDLGTMSQLSPAKENSHTQPPTKGKCLMLSKFGASTLGFEPEGLDLSLEAEI